MEYPNELATTAMGCRRPNVIVRTRGVTGTFVPLAASIDCGILARHIGGEWGQ